MCTASSKVSLAISSALTNIGTFEGIRVSQMLSKVTKILDEANDPNKMMLCTSGEDETDGAEDALSEGELSNKSSGGWSPQSPQHQPLLLSGTSLPRLRSSPFSRALNSRIRQDLRLAKAAGFRVGHLGSLFTPEHECVVVLSCRIAKLGISEEALQAWQLSPNQYFVLLIRYSEGYRTLERLTAEEAWGQGMVRMRVGVSQKHKIGTLDAIRAFSEIQDKAQEYGDPVHKHPTPTPSLDPFFMDRPLNELLNDRLARLLSYRLDRAFSWGRAENFYNDLQGRNSSDFDDIIPKYWEDKADPSKILPDLVTADHLTQKLAPHSFPLLAMQFALRHLVRCTEFCLVCHCRVEENFEALKPYVCSKPLCLYQYIRLGFGPSIEHEIISQPHVVDLLISFCYSSAFAEKLRSFPVGMALLVPSVTLMPSIRPPGSVPAMHEAGAKLPTFSRIPTNPRMDQEGSASSLQATSRPAAPSVDSVIHKAKLDSHNKELLLSSEDRTLRAGQWLFISLPGSSEERWHCKVIGTLYSTVRLGPPIIRSKFTSTNNANQQKGSSEKPQHHAVRITSQNQQPAVAGPDVGLALNRCVTLPNPPPTQSTRMIDVEFIVYDQNFDDFNNAQKQCAICVLLGTLPSVGEMKDFLLQSNTGKHNSLQDWSDRISPAALGVLRWIIASNRSCIIQVDNLDGDAKKAEERVSGMPEWMQFRFAQGAPDKEQRFVTSVRDTSKHLEYPTLFAWHGSPLPNWHGIVREGLHFRNRPHGRAYGDGVYHALNVTTSLAFSGSNRRSGSAISQAQGEWPHSGLKISEAVVLNEIVNAPKLFVSNSPHLVVAQLDWIQTRYLFVKCNMPGLKFQDKAPTEVYAQDPAWTPTGFPPGHKTLIPITAVSKSRRPASKIARSRNKRVKTDSGKAESEFDDGGVLSDETDIEDITILLSDEEDVSSHATSNMANTKNGANLFKRPSEPAKTGFVPGTLDHSKLPLLEAPSYATPMATKALQRELSNTLQVQATHPAHELGWYIDPNLVSNVYQWIVELHSFEDHLPLAKDMKDKGLASVVVEIRFGKDYPISPPFVRVIRPRFLLFMAGGGGHVTAGGALCMELLTNSGWSAVSNIESVLLQVRLAISSTDPKPARIEPGKIRDYGVGEAVEAFVRACNAHGVSFYES